MIVLTTFAEPQFSSQSDKSASRLGFSVDLENSDKKSILIHGDSVDWPISVAILISRLHCDRVEIIIPQSDCAQSLGTSNC